MWGFGSLNNFDQVFVIVGKSVLKCILLHTQFFVHYEITWPDNYRIAPLEKFCGGSTPPLERRNFISRTFPPFGFVLQHKTDVGLEHSRRENMVNNVMTGAIDGKGNTLGEQLAARHQALEDIDRAKFGWYHVRYSFHATRLISQGYHGCGVWFLHRRLRHFLNQYGYDSQKEAPAKE
jgi:hypothetical protein